MTREDSLWIRQLIEGNDLAFKMLYDHYSPKVYNTLLSYTKNAEDAEELLQDVFMTVYNTAKTFRADSSVSTWIYRISVNKALDFLRKKNSTKRFGIFSSLYKKDSAEIKYESVDFIHPGVKLENQENARILFRVIDELSEKQKTVFILTQIEDLSQQEVADILQTTRKAVESLLQRAKANLKVALEKHFPERGNSPKNPS
ncbi:RNA polymerase sigma factor [Algoriphagus winogradskyi]|uniref:RNA polymerase sigma factor n=1 Tax=Algoriphagus winogradskyi TaxID=237017 RepID=A0ABY1PE47_9BACT|nr:RNA polymerase sigma factor [Algoriphagus winogradskyi]SMP32416.1 RNA polymerase sigma-70 factor, ECF subfamily [Algoriphagus winogradskyi]